VTSSVRPNSSAASSARRGGRGRPDEGSERRAALVELAAELFADRGYRATTVREIADAAGVLSGSLYHHFDSKESIIDELLSSYLDELLAQYRAIVAEGGSSIEVLSRLVQAAFGSFDRHRAAITVFQNERQYLLQFPRFSYLAKSEQSVGRIWMRSSGRASPEAGCAPTSTRSWPIASSATRSGLPCAGTAPEDGSRPVSSPTSTSR
jgi:AcrR family transcriptional regulator